MKNILLLVTISVILVGCQESTKPKYRPNAPELKKLFELIEVNDRKISFYLTSESIDLLLKMEVYPFEREGRKYLLRVNKKMSSTDKVPLPFELVRMDHQPNAGDIRVVGYSYALKANTVCESEDCAIQPEDIDKIYYQMQEGGPEVLHQANVKLIANNNQWIRSRSTFYRYDGHIYQNELDEHKAMKLDCGIKYPFGRARTTWFHTNQFFDTYTHIKCDD